MTSVTGSYKLRMFLFPGNLIMGKIEAVITLPTHQLNIGSPSACQWTIRKNQASKEPTASEFQ